MHSKGCESVDLTYEITNLDRLNDEIVDCTESNSFQLLEQDKIVCQVFPSPGRESFRQSKVFNNKVISDVQNEDTSLESLDFIENRSSPDSGILSADTTTADFDSNCAIDPHDRFLDLSPRNVNIREPNIEDLQSENSIPKEDRDLMATIKEISLIGVESRFVAHPVGSAVSFMPAGPVDGPVWIQLTSLPLRDEVGEVLFLVSRGGEKVSIPATVLLAVSKTLQIIVTEDTFMNIPVFAISLPFDKDTLFAFREIVLFGKASNVGKCKKQELEEIWKMLGMSPTKFEIIFPTATVRCAMGIENSPPQKPVVFCSERIEEEGNTRPVEMFSGGRQRRGRKVKKSTSLAGAPAQLRHSTRRTGRKTVETSRSA